MHHPQQNVRAGVRDYKYLLFQTCLPWCTTGWWTVTNGPTIPAGCANPPRPPVMPLQTYGAVRAVLHNPATADIYANFPLTEFR